jgi:hypothetical protein
MEKEKEIKQAKMLLNIAIFTIVLNIVLLASIFLNTKYADYINGRINFLTYTDIDTTLKIISILVVINSVSLIVIFYAGIRDIIRESLEGWISKRFKI